MSDLRNGSMDADKEREDGVHMNMNTKIEELLAVLKKKEDDKQKKYSPLGVGDHWCCGSSSRNRVCRLPFLRSGLSGGF